MADDTTLRSPQGASRIALSEDHEVACWTKECGVSKEQHKTAVDAIDTVGDGAAAVEAHFTSL